MCCSLTICYPVIPGQFVVPVQDIARLRRKVLYAGSRLMNGCAGSRSGCAHLDRMSGYTGEVCDWGRIVFVVVEKYESEPRFTLVLLVNDK